MSTNNRLLSLDVMRGITIAGMILVNNPGTWAHIYTPLEHAEWNGLTPTDLVFPFFMFIMGVSTCFSLRKYDFKFTTAAVLKILKRSLLLILIGWAIGWFSRTWAGLLDPDKTFWQAICNFEYMRYLGVFPRLGLCYCATALIALAVDVKWMKWIVALLLVGYGVLLLVGHGFEFTQENIVGVVDRALLGEKHMYSDVVGGQKLDFDPEGLLSTLPSIAHCMIGFLCGSMLLRVKDNVLRSYNLFLVGAVLTMAGFLLSYGLPFNKKIWSPTFVLTTCGLASSLLALLVWMIDIKGWKGWGARFFEVFGINPLFLYVLSSVLAISFIRIKVGGGDEMIPLMRYLYRDVLLPCFQWCCESEKTASVCYAILFVLLNWVVGLVLYKKKIYIKI